MSVAKTGAIPNSYRQIHIAVDDFDKELDGKFQLAILLCSAYSTIRSEIPMLKNNDIIQTELEDNNIKRLYDFVLKKESLRNDILQQICKNIFEKSFYFY